MERFAVQYDHISRYDKVHVCKEGHKNLDRPSNFPSILPALILPNCQRKLWDFDKLLWPSKKKWTLSIRILNFEGKFL